MRRRDPIELPHGQASDLQPHEVFPAIITGSFRRDGDDPAANIFVLPRFYTFRPTSNTGIALPPGGMWRVGDDCTYELDKEDGEFAAININEIFRDVEVKYFKIPNGTPVLIMMVRQPELDVYDPNCGFNPVPNLSAAPSWLFYFDCPIDPESTWCDCDAAPVAPGPCPYWNYPSSVPPFPWL